MVLSLRSKLLFLFLILFIFIFGIFSFWAVQKEREIFQKTLQEKAKILAISLDAMIYSKEQLRDFEKLRSDIQKFMWLYPELIGISIALPSQDGLKIVVSNKFEEIGKLAEPEAILSFEERKFLTKTNFSPTKIFSAFSPIHLGGEVVGAYHIKLSLEAEEKVIAQRKREMLSAIFFGALTLYFFLYLMFEKFLISPLLKIKKGVEEISRGNLDWKIMVKSQDEIGALARGVNEMAGKLKELYQGLREKVKEATGELEKKIIELEKISEERAIASIRVSALAHDAQRKMEELERTRIALMNILEDVHEEKEKTEKERQKTLAIIENFADGLLVFDEEGKIALINPRAMIFFGVKEKEVVGKKLSELLTFSSFQSLFSLLGPELKNLYRKELKLQEDLILEVSTVPIILEEKKTWKLLILHDVTREKAIEKLKSEFVSLAAHQLRTPLSAIKWTMKMLLDGDLGQITKEQREYIEKTYRTNERLISLINDLLNVTRIEEGRYLYKLVLADIVPIVESTINLYGEEIKRKKLKLKFEKPKEALPQLKVDTEKISLVIQNLIENAVRYTLEGGEIKVCLKKKENEVEFSVKDTGIGIPKKEQPRVFTKFFRSSSAMKMDTEGTGLGLFITKNIVEAHGGKIWFESEEGKGTTFYFTLPISNDMLK